MADLLLRIRITADGKAAIDGTREVEGELDRLGQKGKKAGKDASDGLSQIEIAARRVSQAIAAYFSFYLLKNFTDELFKVQARLQDLQSQFTALAGDRAAEQFAYVQEAATRLSMDLDGARASYGKMLVMVDAGLLTIPQSQQMFEGLASYARLAGASADQVGLSMYGLSQALGQGRVQMTELLQITEPLPGSLNKIAEAAGKTTGELRKMVMDQAGPGVSSAQLRDWVIQAFGDAIPVAEKMAGNLSATLTRVKNDWRLLLEQVGGDETGFAGFAKSTLDNAGRFFRDLAEQFRSGQIRDSWTTQLDYLQGYWKRFKESVADDRFWEDVNWGWENVKDGLGELGEDFKTVFRNFPEIVANYTVIAASRIQQWALDVGVIWEQVKTWAVEAFQGMRQALISAFSAMETRAAELRQAMGGAFAAILEQAAAALDALPGFMNFAGLADSARKTATDMRAARAQELADIEQARAAALAESAAIVAAQQQKLAALKDSVAAQKEAMDQAAQATVLEQQGYTAARDAAYEKLQTDRRLAESAKAYRDDNERLNRTLQESAVAMKAADEAASAAFSKSSVAIRQAITDAERLAAAWGQGARAADDAGARIEAAKRAQTEQLPIPTGTYQNVQIDALVRAIMRAESGSTPEKLNAHAVSGAGAIGVMQVMPATGQGMGYSREDLFDPAKNISAGTKYIQQLLDQFKSLPLALAAYNGGMGNLQKNGLDVSKMGTETQAYVPKVLGYYQQELAKNSGEANKALTEQIILNEELGKIDAERLVKGAQQMAQERQKAQIAQVAAQLLRGDYQDVKTDALLIPADQIREEMTGLMALNMTREQAADAVAKAIESTTGLRSAQQAQQAIQTSLAASVADYQKELAGAALEEIRQIEAMSRRNQLMAEQSAALAALAQGPVALAQTVEGIGLQLNAGVTASAAAVSSYFDLVGRVNEEMVKMREQGLSGAQMQQRAAQMVEEFNTKQIASIVQATTATQEQSKALEKQLAQTLLSAAGFDEYAIQQQVAKMAADTFIVSLGEANKELEKERQVKLKAYEASLRYKAGMEVLNDVLGQGKTALDALKSPADRYAEAIKKADAAQKLLTDPQYIEALGRMGVSIEDAQKYLAAFRQEAERAKEAADPMAKIWDEAAKNIYDAWTGMFESIFTGSLKSFGDLVDSIKTMFLKMLAQMAAQALAKPILLPMMMGMGVGSGTIDNLFGAGTFVNAASGASSGGGLLSNLSSGFGLFGQGGLGSSVGGMISGLGGLLGSSGLSAGGAMLGNLGLIPGVGQAFSAGATMMTTGSAGIGAGMIASAALPIVGALTAIAGLLTSFGPTPHPSSLAVAGGYNDPKWGPGYLGKGGGGVYGESGMEFGYSYGHTDPKDAEKLRDSLMTIDKALFALIPTANMAGVQLGAFGQTAEGFIAGFRDYYVEGADEMTALFVKDWVKAAAAMGAIDASISAVLQNMEGNAEDITKALGGLLNIKKYIDADPAKDIADLMNKAVQSPMQALNSLRAELETLARNFDGSAQAAVKLGDASQNLYQAELQMIQQIQATIQGITASIAGSIEDINLSLMSTAEKTVYYQQQAEAAYAALTAATDPSEIAKQAEAARAAIMQVWGTLSEEQKTAQSGQFTLFLHDIQTMATAKLNEQQQAVLDQHEATAKTLADALDTAGKAAAEAMAESAAVMADAVGSAADQVAAALRTPITVNVESHVTVDAVSVPAHASGGLARPGWALVGEQGPELINFTAPGRVYTADDTRALMTPPERAPAADAAPAAPEMAGLVRQQTQNSRAMVGTLREMVRRLANLERRQRLAY